MSAPSAFDESVARLRNGGCPEDEAARLWSLLEDRERLDLLDGDMSVWQGLGLIRQEGYGARPYVMGTVERLGIPGIRFVDGPRGCVSGKGTAFPVPMARGATWDVELEEEVGDVIGREVRLAGGNFFGGICVNLPRHPAWGRAQESYGDEPYHLGEFGAALARGTQRHVMACVKHFALNSMENARFTVDVSISQADLHDIYLPHFRRVADEGVASVMSAYNSVNGEWAGQNRQLLTEVLRDQWKWPGFTISDFVFGLRDAGKSVEAGLDLEAPFSMQRAHRLPGQLEAGDVDPAAIKRAGLRLLAGQLQSYATRSHEVTGEMADGASRELARKVAGRAMVLLKNEPVDGAPILPLPQQPRSIALIGRLALEANMGDRGSSNVRAPSHVTPFDGIRAAWPGAEIVVIAEDDPAAAAQAAAECEIAIVVAGYDYRDEGEFMGEAIADNPALTALFPPLPGGVPAREQGAPPDLGEGGDRAALSLRHIDEMIIRAVADANSRTVVAIVASGAVIMEEWRGLVPAILMMWYAGMEGGNALADVLSGRVNPAGRLPYSIPASEKHLPWFDRDATAITYDRWHGQRLLDRLGVEPAFPHGYGLSYTEFEIEGATIVRSDPASMHLVVEVANKGSRDGRHTVQIYGSRHKGPGAGERFLTGFAGADIPAGETMRVVVQASLVPLAQWSDADAQRILPNPSEVAIEIGSYAGDPAGVRLEIAEASPGVAQSR